MIIQRLNKIGENISSGGKGSWIRARVKWIEQGERSTKYCLGLEKNSVRKKEIKQLKSQNGKRTIRKQEEIIKEVRRFYAQLYNNESKNVKKWKSNVFTQNINQLSNDDKEICDGLLTVDECKHAIFTMKKKIARLWRNFNRILPNILAPNKRYTCKCPKRMLRNRYDVQYTKKGPNYSSLQERR